MVPQRIGRRIAALRQKGGWTQQSLAERLGISRVAVSHIEADISMPEERTVSLMAGLFKVPPHELVAGTTYPQAKADRLPAVVCTHTLQEVGLALMENDLAWLARLAGWSGEAGARMEIRQRWHTQIELWLRETTDEGLRAQLAAGAEKLNHLD